MPASSAVSPLLNAEGPVRVVVTSEGADVSETAELISVTVRRAVNKVPSATLVFADGDMPEQSFPLSDAAHFKPGAKVTLKAGYGDSEALIFSGIVVRHGLTIAGSNDARLVVECRDEAVKLTVGRKNSHHLDKTDADVITALVAAHGLGATVSGAALLNAELVQHYCTDWDFLLARAEANGCLVVVTDGKVAVGAPQTTGAAALAVKYGESLIDFQADLDARHQYASVQATAWDMKTQAIVQSAAENPATLSAQGNINSQTLSQVLGLSTLALQSGAPWPKAALDGWAKAQQLKSGLARLRGRMRFQGSALATVGGLIDLQGVGQRFNGTVFVTGLTHQIESGEWTTEADFGTPVEWFTERADIAAPAAAGLVPGIEGLHVGVVVKLDADPAGEHRVQVKVPSAGVDTVWARLMQFYASSAFGAFFVPEVGDEVVLGWFNDDPGFPVILGSLYSSKRAPPHALTAENNVKAIVTRCKARFEINDEDKVITLTTPGNNKLVFSDKDKSIVMTDQNNNKVELHTGGIVLDSPKDIKISAKGTISIDAVGAITISSKADVKVEGLNVSCDAKVGMVAKGAASAELSAAGQTTVKGAMVMIN